MTITAELDAQAAAILEMFSGLPPFDFNTLQIDDYRMLMEQPSPFAPGDEIERREMIQIPASGHLLNAAVYTPYKHAAPSPVLIFFHGGGFVAGKLEQHDNICRVLATRAQCVVLSVDYRLAPEHPFPAGLDDAWTALQWVINHADSQGWDKARIAVGGDSAGGNLAAVLAQQAVAAHITLKHQVLLYPVLDLARESESYECNGHGYFLTAPMMRWFKKQYLGNNVGFAKDVRVSPTYAAIDPAVASATIVVAGFDPLRDEAMDYAQKLSDAGVSVSTELYEGQIHGFASMLGMIDQAEQALEQSAFALLKAFKK